MWLVEVVLLAVAWFTAHFGVEAWDAGDRMAACGFWTAAGLAAGLALAMAADRWGREP